PQTIYATKHATSTKPRVGLPPLQLSIRASEQSQRKSAAKLAAMDNRAFPRRERYHRWGGAPNRPRVGSLADERSDRDRPPAQVCRACISLAENRPRPWHRSCNKLIPARVRDASAGKAAVKHGFDPGSN